jgi:hypothetical protein
MSTDWLLRVGDGENFIKSSKYKIWCITSTCTNNKYFVNNVKKDDRLWFIKHKSNGKVLAVANYIKHNKRILGPLLDLTLPNDILEIYGDEDWNIEIYYDNLYNINDCDIFTNINGPSPIRKYNDKCSINLPNEYIYICKYSKIKNSF